MSLTHPYDPFAVSCVSSAHASQSWQRNICGVVLGGRFLAVPCSCRRLAGRRLSHSRRAERRPHAFSVDPSAFQSRGLCRLCLCERREQSEMITLARVDPFLGPWQPAGLTGLETILTRYEPGQSLRSTPRVPVPYPLLLTPKRHGLICTSRVGTQCSSTRTTERGPMGGDLVKAGAAFKQKRPWRPPPYAWPRSRGCKRAGRVSMSHMIRVTLPDDTHELDVLVLLDLVPRALVTVTVPDDLRALREAVKVVASADDGTRDDGDNGDGLGGDVLADLGEEGLSCQTTERRSRRRKRDRVWAACRTGKERENFKSSETRLSRRSRSSRYGGGR